MTAPGMTPGNPKRIIIADDDPDVLMLLEMMLKEKGYVVDVAHDGKECLQKISQHLPDVIVLDIMMPEMNGGQVARVLKSHPKTSMIPIIFLTAIADKKTMKTALFELGVEFYLTKPFDGEDLLDKVQEAIRYKVDPPIRG